MQFHKSSGDDAPETMREMFGPQAVDQAVRQAISTCWMMLPKEKRSAAAVETEIRRIVDRAIDNLKEDASVFGITENG